MALIKTVNGIIPQIGKNCYLAENATIIGDVVIGDHCSVWFQAVIRGDVHFIRIGDETNIQDGAVIHCTYKKASTTVGNSVSIAHNAIVHGCVIEDRVLIGIGAIVMDHAVIQTESIIAAGAVILPDTKVEPRSVYAGVPAKKIKDVDSTMMEVFDRTASNYMIYSDWYRNS